MCPVMKSCPVFYHSILCAVMNYCMLSSYHVCCYQLCMLSSNDMNYQIPICDHILLCVVTNYYVCQYIYMLSSNTVYCSNNITFPNKNMLPTLSVQFPLQYTILLQCTVPNLVQCPHYSTLSPLHYIVPTKCTDITIVTVYKYEVICAVFAKLAATL